MENLNQLLLKLSNFYTVVESWLSSMWDMFFSTTAGNVAVKKLKSDGTIETVNMPNKASMKSDFDTWKGTVQPQINAINKRVGGKVFYGEKTHSIAPGSSINGYDVFDPDILSLMESGNYYGGLEFDTGQVFGDTKVYFFEIEIVANFSGLTKPLYSRAIAELNVVDSSLYDVKVNQLEGGSQIIGAIGIEDVAFTAFRIVLCTQVTNTAMQDSDVPTPTSTYCRIRELSSDIYQ